MGLKSFFLHMEGNNYQSEEPDYRMGENLYPLFI
jgi:hypothetical protein